MAWVVETQATELRAQSIMPLGSAPAVVAARDLNWNFIPDLVAVNPAADTITVIPVSGFAGTAGALDYAVGATPVAVTLADLSGDGYVDIAVANRESDTLSVLTSKAVEGVEFYPASSYGAGSGPLAIAAGRFDNNGSYDLVVVNQATDSITVLLNSGSGAFPATVSYGVGTFPVAVAAGDFNGDGALDLAVVNQGGNTVSLLLNDGSGAFAAPLNYAAGSAPSAIAVLDAEGDGVLDIAVTNATTATLSLLHNSGNGSFVLAASYGVGESPTAVVAVDMNGDGYDDLAVTNGGAGTVTLLESRRDGAFTLAQTAAVGVAPSSLAVADLDLDGDSDLVVANSGAATLSLLMNDTDFRPTPFTFTDQVDVPRNSSVESDVVTLAGMTGWGRITVSAGEYSVSSDGGASWSPWSGSSPAAVTTGDQIRLRITASAQLYTTLEMQVTVGGVVDSFSVRSYGDTVPDPFHFIDQAGAAPNSIISSNMIRVTGIEVDLPIHVVGGMYSINGGAFTTTPGYVSSNDTVQLRVTSPPLNDGAVDVVLYIGEVSDTFSVSSAAAKSSGGGGGVLGLPLSLLMVSALLGRYLRRHV